MEGRVSFFLIEVLKIASNDCFYFPRDIWDILILIHI